ncbi:MAG TPA: YihY/virulence factor BrkB family protein [Terriglobales bacterium]
MHFTRLRRALWQAFIHGQYSVAKAAAYSSILTVFPAFLVLASVLEASHNTEMFLQQISAGVRFALPPGSRAAVLAFFQGQQHHTTRIIYSASAVMLLAATGMMISWMEGFRRAYEIPNTWGFWQERAVAIYLVLLALVPLGFATLLVAFGDQIENWLQNQTMHLYRPLILLVWDGVRWAIALSTSVAMMSLIYHNGLPKHQSWRRVLPGACLSTFLWFAATTLFGWYVTHYATYNVVYGPLAAAIALLVWLYIVSAIVLLGAELNAQFYPRTSDNGARQKEGLIK